MKKDVKRNMKNENEEDIEKIIKEFIEGDCDKEFKIYSVYQSLKKKEEKNEDEQYVYNEFSLQHELGNYLRYKLNKKTEDEYIVKFEYNINDLLDDNETIDTCKKEIDILMNKILRLERCNV